MKNRFSNCFPLLYICLHCDEVCVCWHVGAPGAPGTPGFYVRAQHDPEKNSIYLIFRSTGPIAVARRRSVGRSVGLSVCLSVCQHL